MNIELKLPWIAIGEFASHLAIELVRELSKMHPLYNKNVLAIAQRIDSDDVLFAFEDQTKYAVVHLTWSGNPEPDPRWPDTTFYDSLEEWARYRMMPDHAEFTS